MPVVEQLPGNWWSYRTTPSEASWSQRQKTEKNQVENTKLKNNKYNNEHRIVNVTPKR